jgi:hypothetical protein
MIPQAQYVGNVAVNRFESGICYLPFFDVFGLGNVSHMDRHDDVHLLLVLFDPFGLLKETGSLITNAWPVLLSLSMPDISVTLRVRKNDQGKIIRLSLGRIIPGSAQFFDVSSVNVDIVALAEDGNTLASRCKRCKDRNKHYGTSQDLSFLAANDELGHNLVPRRLTHSDFYTIIRRAT